jgi:HflK protein
MHQHHFEFSAHMPDDRGEKLRYFGFTAVVGVLLLLNLLDIWKFVFGIDTAAILAVIAGYKTFYNAISGLLEKKITADLAICIAVIAALAVGEYLAAAEAMFIMLVGEGLEGYAATRTSRAISKFVEQMPRTARLLKDGEEVEVDAAALLEGDLIMVRAGERIPADGEIEQGNSAIDEANITGESLPADKAAGDEVFSGTLNGHGLLRIRVLRSGEDTTLARVIRLVEEAKDKRAPVERLADRYAKYFVPTLLAVAAGTYYFTGDWMRTVAVLIIGCPCALILATPTAMVAAIGGLARRGILVRGGSVLQLASKVDAIFFDKTGTVTEGKFEILQIVAEGGTEEDVLRLAAAAESGSDHMLARVIVDTARERGIDVPAVDDARILPGRGAECRHDGQTLRAGSAAFLDENGIRVENGILDEADRLGATAVLVAEGDRMAGAILLRDRVRQGIKKAAHQLEHLEIGHQVILTGDRRKAAEAIAREVGIPNVEAELLPEEKVEKVRQLASQGRQVAMVGDGVNDAPALATAQVGIAVAGASDITAEAADIVYMPRSLDRLPVLFEVARRAVSTAWLNIILFAGIVNVAAVGLASTGIVGPLGAAVFHQLSSLFVILNSLRLLRVPQEKHSHGHHHHDSGILHWLEHRIEHTPLPRFWQRAKAAAARVDLNEGFHYLIVNRRRFARPVLLGAAAFYLLSGLYTLGPDEVGVIERFGKKVLPHTEPGLHYKLVWPIEKLTRVAANRVRTIEVGFRSGTEFPDAEPAAYEWNVQHRSGRFQRKPEESLMLSGDQNMLELTATVHYRLVRPDDFLFGLLDGEGTIRVATEGALQSVVRTTPLDDALTTERHAIEERTREALQARLDRYGAGVEVMQVRLLDVHPSLEVVDSFRDVSGAYEEKNRLINEAEGYRNEQVALARGNAEANKVNAAGYSLGRKNRAAGDAARFTQSEAAYRAAPAVNDTRLYLETMEEILTSRSKMIVDSTRGRRHLTLVDDGLGISPAVPPQQFYQPEGEPGPFGEQPAAGQQPEANREQE